MPAWAQIFFAVVPVVVVVLTAVIWIVHRIATLEGKVDAMLALLAALVTVLGGNPGTKEKLAGFRVPEP
jgi:hypothetical protein